MAENRLRLLIIGAHPDDADYHAGGLATLYARGGHVVQMSSLTNGDAGHPTIRGPALAQRRSAEAEAAGAVIGAQYLVMDQHDGELQPTIANRREVIRLLRTFEPDLVLTHRPNDYHPDHRAAAQLVQDAAYMMTVPAIVPEVPHLLRDPVIAYLPDRFRKPCPFEPDVVIDVDSVMEQIIAMLHCHESQFYEWLPFNTGRLHEVPADLEARRQWLAGQVQARLRAQAERFRGALLDRYGVERGRAIQYAEAYEVCEYGSPLDPAARGRLFDWLR